jgi:hypothetical protein
MWTVSRVDEAWCMILDDAKISEMSLNVCLNVLSLEKAPPEVTTLSKNSKYFDRNNQLTCDQCFDKVVASREVRIS